MDTSNYRVRRAVSLPELSGQWESRAWREAEPLEVNRFHPRSSDHHPQTRAKLLHSHETLHVLFQVQDRFVRSVHTAYDSDTYKDSCVELFLQPPQQAGYFALEVNAGGAFSLRFIEDPTRTANRFAKWCGVSTEDAARLRVAHSLPETVEPELAEPTAWWIEVAWPVAAMEPYCGPIGRLDGQRWRGNLFKCGDETSHPHWASWAPIGFALNFHQPQYFGVIEFE